MGSKPAYTSADALVDLGGKPSETEIERLIKYYPTYQYAHRAQLLQGLFDGKSHEELVLGKMTAKGLDTSITKQAKGGHGRWVVAKVRKAVIRLLYLRCRLNDGKSRRKANQEVGKKFKFSNANDGGQSIIRKYTHSPVLDGSTTL
jgi:hypothetical protein